MSVFSEASLISRQNLYKTYVHCDDVKLERSEQLKLMVISILDEHKGWSGAQVYRYLCELGVKIGKGRFYKMIKDGNLTMSARRKSWKRSHKPKKPAKNNIINQTFHKVFEVLFTDYTEINTLEGKIQLLLVEDLVSRYVTSYKISDTCSSGPVVEALKESMELKASLGLKYKTILHSDRGSEFVNHAVENLSHECNFQLSNTGRIRCFENPFMASLNRTLKHSFGLRVKFSTKAEAEEAIKDAVFRYNHKHKHSSIGKLVPRSALMSYTGKKRAKPEVKSGSYRPSGRGARTYCKSLSVKVKKINLDKTKKSKK